MERGNRLAARSAPGRCEARSPGACLRRVPILLLAGFLSACASLAGGGEGGQEPKALTTGKGVETETSQTLEIPEELPIIVTLAVDEATESESGNAIAEVTARVLERLKATMPAEALAEVRTFSFFPIIALRAGPELIFRLLAMPEVVSIERDHEIRALGGEPLSPKSPAGESGAPIEPEESLNLKLE